MEFIYRLENIKKGYEGCPILDIDQMEIRRGEILTLVGPSGAGKSTLLRLLNFLEYPDEGTLRYDDLELSPNFPLARRREVTTVFQHPALLQDSVEANIAYGLKLRAEHNGKVEMDAIIQRMGLEKLRRQRARKLSGGEAQRVALARAVILHPQVLLLDEPTANLDPYNIGLIEDVVREINEQQKTTIVLVTHNIFQARRLSHRIGLMLAGRIVEMTSSQQFFESPIDPRTRAFVNGEMVY